MNSPLKLTYDLILGSGSPRRKELLQDMGFHFEVRKAEVDETIPAGLNGKKATEYLARLKAEALSSNLKKNELILTADTLVFCDEQALGKPTNREEAIAFLTQLSGRSHQVITAVGLLNHKRLNVFSETTIVRFNQLNAPVIEYYVDTFQPFDKAGAYGIQEWIGQVGVAGIEGCYFNVIGLPTARLFLELQDYT